MMAVKVSGTFFFFFVFSSFFCTKGNGLLWFARFSWLCGGGGDRSCRCWRRIGCWGDATLMDAGDFVLGAARKVRFPTVGGLVLQPKSGRVRRCRPGLVFALAGSSATKCACVRLAIA